MVNADGDASVVITKDNIYTAYGIDAEVYFNTFSQQLDFYVVD